MATILLTFSTVLTTTEGRVYKARACGREGEHGLWEGWIEFVSDDGQVLRSGRETTQPNLTDLEYWATGVTPVYLEGALERTLAGPTRATPPPPPPETPAYDRPAPSRAAAPDVVSHPILDPFSVYAKGDDLLRQQLSALSPWHLRSIIRAYNLASEDVRLEGLTGAELSALILTGVRARLAA